MSGLLLPLRRRPTAAHPQRATVTIRGNYATFTDPADALAALTLPGEMPVAARRYLAEHPPTPEQYAAAVRERGPRIVGLFEGYGGLTMGVQSVLGGTLAAYAEIEPAMVKLLARRHPGVPNLGDVSTTDWAALRTSLLREYGVEHAGHLLGVIMTGGFPCQDVSLAGLRAGLKAGTRSGLWSEFARGIDVIRPGLVVIENVRGLLSAEATGNVEPDPWAVGDGPDGPALRALGAVLGDLADLGYDARWCGVRAADAGAPHGRYRVFIVASPADANVDELAREWIERAGRAPAARDRDIAAPDDARVGREGRRSSAESTAAHGRPGDEGRATAQDADGAARGERRIAAPGEAEGGRARPDAGRRTGAPAADADDRGRGSVERDLLAGEPDAAGRAAADAERGRGERRGKPGDLDRTPSAGESDRSERERHGHAPDDRSATPRTWGDYAAAIERWEARLGRIAPAPTNPDGKGGAHRLAPQFVEWMMGLPQGHVTDPANDLTRAQQLKALGNGVVPQQAALAVGMLLEAERVEAVAA